VVWQDPLISVGRETFLADALRWAGAESIIEVKQDWPHVSLEEIVRLQPDYLVFASAHAEEELAGLAALRTAPVWRDLKAVQENHIVVISEAINRPAPRLVDAIEELAHLLHPAAFVDAPHAGPITPKGAAR
jgi:iron complex transport system substrate-binding protein